MKRSALSASQLLMSDVFDSSPAAVVMCNMNEGPVELLMHQILLDLDAVEAKTNCITICVVFKHFTHAIVYLNRCRRAFEESGHEVKVSSFCNKFFVTHRGRSVTVEAVPIDSHLWADASYFVPDLRVYLSGALWIGRERMRRISAAVIHGDASLLRGVTSLSSSSPLHRSQGCTSREDQLFAYCDTLRCGMGPEVDVAFIYDNKLHYAPKKKQRLL
jgi:hypothetical protein